MECKDDREALKKPGQRWVNTVDALIREAGGTKHDKKRPVAASLTIGPDGQQHIFAVADESGQPVFLAGEGDYGPTLKHLIDELKVVNIGINATPPWPPCPDIRWCEPGVTVRVQHHLSAIVSAARAEKEE